MLLFILKIHRKWISLICFMKLISHLVSSSSYSVRHMPRERYFHLLFFFSMSFLMILYIYFVISSSMSGVYTSIVPFVLFLSVIQFIRSLFRLSKLKSPMTPNVEWDLIFSKRVKTSGYVLNILNLKFSYCIRIFGWFLKFTLSSSSCSIM